VVVDGLFDQLPAGDEVVDRRGRGVGGSKERLAVDLPKHLDWLPKLERQQPRPEPALEPNR
jgi:hypothetical protein